MKIIASTLKINPENQCHLGGNNNDVLAENIQSDLEVNLLMLEETNSIKLIVTMDLLYVGETITEAIRKFATSIVSDECIWISSSHTHNAPHVDIKKPKLGKVDSVYVQMIINRVNAEISKMASNLSDGDEVICKLKVATAPLTINRRKIRKITVTRNGLFFNRVFMQPNKKGKIDPLIRKLEFLDKKGKLIALVWQYTCHPTSFYEPNSVSSHFVGEIRSEVRLRSHSDIPVLFMQGFAGDIRPPTPSKFYKQIFRNLLQGYQFRDFTKQEYTLWIKKLINLFFSDREVVHSQASKNTRPVKINWDSRKFVLNSQSESVSLQIMPLGPIILVGLSCEPTVSLAEDIVNLHEFGQLWPCGYLGDVYGYLPSRKEILSGGYEVDGFRNSFDCGGLTNDGWNLAFIEIEKYFKEVG